LISIGYLEGMENLIAGVEPLQAGPTDEGSNGNGSLIRILPAAKLAYCLYALLVMELLNGQAPATAYAMMRKKARNVSTRLNIYQVALIPLFSQLKLQL